MKNKTIDAAQVWKDFEDLLAPKLNFSVTDRAVYSHLLRHSRLVGKLRIRFSLSWLGPRIRLSARTARESVRRLIIWGVLRLVERSCQAHQVVVCGCRRKSRLCVLPGPQPRAQPNLQARPASGRSISSKFSRAGTQSTPARAAIASIVCAASLPSDGASTTSSRRPASAAIPTATSSLVVWIATH